MSDNDLQPMWHAAWHLQLWENGHQHVTYIYQNAFKAIIVSVLSQQQPHGRFLLVPTVLKYCDTIYLSWPPFLLWEKEKCEKNIGRREKYDFISVKFPDTNIQTTSYVALLLIAIWTKLRLSTELKMLEMKMSLNLRFVPHKMISLDCLLYHILRISHFPIFKVNYLGNNYCMLLPA